MGVIMNKWIATILFSTISFTALATAQELSVSIGQSSNQPSVASILAGPLLEAGGIILLYIAKKSTDFNVRLGAGAIGAILIVGGLYQMGKATYQIGKLYFSSPLKQTES